MKRKLLKSAVLVCAAALVFSGCKKETSLMQDETPVSLHAYGLNPMTDDQWSNVPVFTREVLGNDAKGLSYGTLPSSYLLSSPAVRDQGQIGSCTGFCGAETNEMLNYYKSVSPAVTSTNLDSTSGLPTAVNTQFSGASLFGTTGELSPLFLYYVERCVINGGSITSDPGANMINIAEAFQGLSSNSGSGHTLTKAINGTTYTFAGVCEENYYAYPSNGSNTSTQYTTAPSASAIANAPSFKIATQSGTTGSSGTTTHGYYVINSSTIVNDVKTALVNNKPVMMGFNVYDNKAYQYFEGLGVAGYSPNKFTYNPLTSSGSLISGLRLMGGHAVPIIGYVNQASAPGGGYFIVENSWNTNWGYQGYFYLPYSVITSTKIVPAGSLYVAII
jgi:Papain family cysteine protease